MISRTDDVALYAQVYDERLGLEYLAQIKLLDVDFDVVCECLPYPGEIVIMPTVKASEDSLYRMAVSAAGGLLLLENGESIREGLELAITEQKWDQSDFERDWEGH